MTRQLTLMISLTVVLSLGLQLQLAYSQQFPINPPSSNLSLIDPNQTTESLVESFGSPQALMEQVIKEAQEPGALDRMVDECGILEPDATSIEDLECSERIMNESKEETQEQ